jgi:hypothetical protein
MTKLLEVRHISVSINRPTRDVYDFASDPQNLPRWASGLAGSIARAGDEWIADAPMGKVRIRFTPRNELGVLDHDVTMPSGVTIHNPMRVLPNGRGSEVVFSIFHRPDTSDAKFAEDAKWVEKDLRTLASILEG